MSDFDLAPLDLALADLAPRSLNSSAFLRWVRNQAHQAEPVEELDG